MSRPTRAPNSCHPLAESRTKTKMAPAKTNPIPSASTSTTNSGVPGVRNGSVSADTNMTKNAMRNTAWPTSGCIKHRLPLSVTT